MNRTLFIWQFNSWPSIDLPARKRNLKGISGACRDGSVVSNIYSTYRGSVFISQHPHLAAHHTFNSRSADLTFSPGLCRYCTHMHKLIKLIQRHRIHTYINNQCWKGSSRFLSWLNMGIPNVTGYLKNCTSKINNLFRVYW